MNSKVQLSQLGVDVIEAGFPVSSPADFEAVKQIAIEVGNEVQVRREAVRHAAVQSNLNKT